MLHQVTEKRALRAHRQQIVRACDRGSDVGRRRKRFVPDDKPVCRVLIERHQLPEVRYRLLLAGGQIFLLRRKLVQPVFVHVHAIACRKRIGLEQVINMRRLAVRQSLQRGRKLQIVIFCRVIRQCFEEGLQIKYMQCLRLLLRLRSALHRGDKR